MSSAPWTHEQQLLDAIYDAPGDDDVRSVYADLLLTRGQERGEFIQLQLKAEASPLTRAEDGRMKALLEHHRDSWLGPLRRFVNVGTVIFRRGFLAACTVKPPPDNDVFKNSRQWSTLEDVSCKWNARVSPAMHSVRRIQAWLCKELVTIQRLPDRTPIEELVLETTHLPKLAEYLPPTLRATSRFPRLSRVVLTGHNQSFVSVEEVAAILAWLNEPPSGLRSLVLRSGVLSSVQDPALRGLVAAASRRVAVDVVCDRGIGSGDLWRVVFTRPSPHGDLHARLSRAPELHAISNLVDWLASTARRVVFDQATFAPNDDRVQQHIEYLQARSVEAVIE